MGARKIIGELLALGLVFAVFTCADNQRFVEPLAVESEVIESTVIIEEEPKEIVETVYLTDADFEKLYTLKPDIRKEDRKIVNLDLSDAILMMKVGREEGGPTLLGQLWVMCTIYNRFIAGWGDSIWEILNQEDQFTVVTNGSYLNADVNVESHLALAMLESGYNPTEGALYWEANTNSPNSWHKTHLTFIKEVEGNLYYK